MIESHYSYGVLALELCPGQIQNQTALSVLQASELGEWIANDLRAWVAPHADIDISIAGACFDSVEILRPGWPIHKELTRLTQLAPKSVVARVLSFGASAQQMPDGLQPNVDFISSPMRLIPFVLSGSRAAIAEIQQKLEADLMERGMAGAQTALCAQELFAVNIEHARYMTLHDLLALMNMQYQHNGLENVWPIIEAALFAPQQYVWLDCAPEPLLFFKNNTAHIALLDSHQWALLQSNLGDKNAEQLEQHFQWFQMRQRQIAALLEAHGIAVEFDFCADANTARDTLQS